MTHNSLQISACIPRTWRILLFLSMMIEIDRYDNVLLLNEHGDQYFLLHNFGVEITPFKSKRIKKNYQKEKKISLKTYTEPLTHGSIINNDLENNDSKNVSSRGCFSLSDFSINYKRQSSICSRLPTN